MNSSLKKIISLFIFVAGLVAAVTRAEPLPTPVTPTTVTINPHKNWGTWDGWGTSLAWWAKVFGDRDDLADLLFTTKPVKINDQVLPGLGLNIARYNAGACSWNEIDGRRMVVSKIILPYRQIEGFWLDGKTPDPQSPGWNWSVDGNQRAMLLKAHDRGANHLELFSNSPMWWMCANDNPSGAAKATNDNLLPKNHGAFAVYLAAIARQAKDHWGIAFTTVEPFNEPTSKWWHADGKQEGCHFSPAAQSAVLPLLRAELDRRGLTDLPIASSDESYYDEALKTWKSFNASTRALIAQVNVHGYQQTKGHRAELYQLVKTEANKRLWNSEYGEKDASGMELARNLNRDFNALHPTAWCYWQPLDGGGWGLLPTDFAAKTIGAVNPKYFVLAHYTRHIRPGMTILDSSDANTVAAYDASAKKLVIVTLNDGPARTIPYDLSLFATAKGPVTRWVTEPAGSARYQLQPDHSSAGPSFACPIPAHSIQTVEISNVSAP